MHGANEHRRVEQEDIIAHRGEVSRALDVPDQALEMDAQPPHQEDGGKRAWLQVLGSFLIFVNIWGFTFIFGIFQSFYELSYLPSKSASSISWIGTVQSALLIIVGVLAGPLYDRGAYRTMMLSGSTLILLGLFMLSLSKGYYQIFLSQGIAVGIGGGLLYVPSLALVSSAFKRRRAIAMGVVTCGIGLGGVVYVSAFQSLLPHLGFAWTVRAIAFIALVVFLISVPLLIFNSPQKPSSNRTKRQLFDRAALKDATFLAYSVSSFLIFLGYLVPFFYIPSYAQIALGTSRSLSFWALAISSATSIFGRLGAAFAAQKFGTMLPWTFCGCVSGVLCFIWIRIVSSISAFMVFGGLYGFFSGALVALPATIFPKICRDPNLLGTWLGQAWVFSGFSFLVGAPVAGALTMLGTTSAQTINFLPVQIWSGTMLLLGTAGLGVMWSLLVKLRSEKILI